MPADSRLCPNGREDDVCDGDDAVAGGVVVGVIVNVDTGATVCNCASVEGGEIK